MANRILILTNRIPYPLHDGGALAMHAMLQGYFDASFDVHLLAMNTTRHYVAESHLPALYRRIGFTTHDIDTDIRLLPVLKNFLMSREPNHATRFFDRNFERKIQRLIDSFEPDYVQLESVFLATYLPVIRNSTRAPIIFRLHNIEHKIWQRMAEDRRIGLRRYYLMNLAERMRLFEHQAWQQADLLLAISAYDAALVRQDDIRTPLHVAPYGLTVQENSTITGAMTEGYHLGAMDWIPNADGISWFMQEVWPMVHKAAPSFRFTFAGRNMPPSFMRLQTEGAVCAGEVADARAFVASKGILIIPLHSGSGIRVKALEGMATGKLVIATSIGIQGIEGALDGVHFLRADTAEDFVRAITFSNEQPEAARRIALNGMQLVTDHYNQATIMNGVISTLKGLKSINRFE